MRSKRSQADDRDVAHRGDDLVRAVGDRGLANDESHRAGPPRLLVDVDDPGAAQVGLTRPKGPEELELLLAVQDARDVRAQVAQECRGIGRLVTERHRERRRRNEVAPLGGRPHPVVEVERVEVADRPGELFDLAALDRHGVRRGLLADNGLSVFERPPINPRLFSWGAPRNSPCRGRRTAPYVPRRHYTYSPTLT